MQTWPDFTGRVCEPRGPIIRSRPSTRAWCEKVHIAHQSLHWAIWLGTLGDGANRDGAEDARAVRPGPGQGKPWARCRCKGPERHRCLKRVKNLLGTEESGREETHGKACRRVPVFHAYKKEWGVPGSEGCLGRREGRASKASEEIRNEHRTASQRCGGIRSLRSKDLCVRFL